MKKLILKIMSFTLCFCICFLPYTAIGTSAVTEVATASVLTTGKTVKIGESGDDAEKWTAENNPLDAVEFKGFYEVVNIDGRTAVSFSTKKGDTFSDIIMCYDLSTVSSERKLQWKTLRLWLKTESKAVDLNVSFAVKTDSDTVFKKITKTVPAGFAGYYDISLAEFAGLTDDGKTPFDLSVVSSIKLEVNHSETEKTIAFSEISAITDSVYTMADFENPSKAIGETIHGSAYSLWPSEANHDDVIGVAGTIVGAAVSEGAANGKIEIVGHNGGKALKVTMKKTQAGSWAQANRFLMPLQLGNSSKGYVSATDYAGIRFYAKTDAARELWVYLKSDNTCIARTTFIVPAETDGYITIPFSKIYSTNGTWTPTDTTVSAEELANVKFISFESRDYNPAGYIIFDDIGLTKTVENIHTIIDFENPSKAIGESIHGSSYCVWPSEVNHDNVIGAAGTIAGAAVSEGAAQGKMEIVGHNGGKALKVTMKKTQTWDGAYANRFLMPMRLGDSGHPYVDMNQYSEVRFFIATDTARTFKAFFKAGSSCVGTAAFTVPENYYGYYSIPYSNILSTATDYPVSSEELSTVGLIDLEARDYLEAGTFIIDDICLNSVSANEWYDILKFSSPVSKEQEPEKEPEVLPDNKTEKIDGAIINDFSRILRPGIAVTAKDIGALSLSGNVTSVKNGNGTALEFVMSGDGSSPCVLEVAAAAKGVPYDKLDFTLKSDTDISLKISATFYKKGTYELDEDKTAQISYDVLSTQSEHQIDFSEFNTDGKPSDVTALRTLKFEVEDTKAATFILDGIRMSKSYEADEKTVYSLPDTFEEGAVINNGAYKDTVFPDGIVLYRTSDLGKQVSNFNGMNKIVTLDGKPAVQFKLTKENLGIHNVTYRVLVNGEDHEKATYNKNLKVRLKTSKSLTLIVTVSAYTDSYKTATDYRSITFNIPADFDGYYTMPLSDFIAKGGVIQGELDYSLWQSVTLTAYDYQACEFAFGDIILTRDDSTLKKDIADFDVNFNISEGLLPEEFGVIGLSDNAKIISVDDNGNNAVSFTANSGEENSFFESAVRGDVSGYDLFKMKVKTSKPLELTATATFKKADGDEPDSTATRSFEYSIKESDIGTDGFEEYIEIPMRELDMAQLRSIIISTSGIITDDVVFDNLHMSFADPLPPKPENGVLVDFSQLSSIEDIKALTATFAYSAERGHQVSYSDTIGLNGKSLQVLTPAGCSGGFQMYFRNSKDGVIYDWSGNNAIKFWVATDKSQKMIFRLYQNGVQSPARLKVGELCYFDGVDSNGAFMDYNACVDYDKASGVTAITVPSGFEGWVIIPFTSFELYKTVNGVKEIVDLDLTQIKTYGVYIYNWIQNVTNNFADVCLCSDFDAAEFLKEMEKLYEGGNSNSSSGGSGGGGFSGGFLASEDDTSDSELKFENSFDFNYDFPTYTPDNTTNKTTVSDNTSSEVKTAGTLKRILKKRYVVDDEGIPTAAVVGIIAGASVVAAGAVFAVILIIKKRKKG